MTGPTCMARCRRWTVALFPKRKTKCFTTEASWPVCCQHTLPGAQLYHCTTGHLLTPLYKHRVERGGEAGCYSCGPLSASMDLLTACSGTLSRRQGNQPQES